MIFNVGRKGAKDNRVYLYKDGAYSNGLEAGWFKKSFASATDWSGYITLTEADTYIHAEQTIGASNYGAIVSKPIDLSGFTAQGLNKLCIEVEGYNLNGIGYIKNFDSYNNSSNHNSLKYWTMGQGDYYYNGVAADSYSGNPVATAPCVYSIPLAWSGGSPSFTNGRVGVTVIGKFDLRITKIWLE